MNFRRFTDPILSKPAIVSAVSILALWLGATAGSLTPPGSPSGTMNTLAQIYNSIAGVFDSSTIVADQNGSLIENLKYIESNTVWASVSPDFYSLNSGNVGIGTSSPGAKLDVDGGSINVASTAQGYQIGGVTILRNPGLYNYGVGIGALGAIDPIFAARNTAVGGGALAYDSTGSENAAIGYGAMNYNTTGNDNSALGAFALASLDSGISNVAIGTSALNGLIAGSDNTALGRNAGYSALGDGNVFLGNGAGYGETGSNKLYIANNTIQPLIYGEFDTGQLIFYGNASTSGAFEVDGVLYANGGCIGCGGVASDSLDFDEFVDLMTLDADTTIASGGFGLTLHPNVGIGGTPTSLAKLVVDAGAGQYPIGIIVSASNHGTSQRATLQLGDQWQLLQDKLGNGTEDFGIWNANNSGYAMAITTTGSVSIGWAGNYSQSKLQVIGNQTIGADWYNIVAPANGLVVEGNVGIGSTAPTYKLEIGTPGDVNIASTGAALYIGGVRMLSGKSPFGATVWVGPNAGINNTSGYLNTAVGADAMRSNNGGYRNTAVGYAAMYSNYNGFMNTAVGDEALYTNSDGAGSGNSALGMQSLYSNNGGFHNTAMGQYAAYANVLGAHIAAFGWEALYNNTSSYNNAMGAQALLSNTSGTYNNAFGYRALYSNTTGSHNTALGEQALFSGTMSDATAVGYLAGYYSSSSNNVFIGSGADVEGVYLSELVTNAIALGTNAKVAASRQLVVGADNGTNYLSEGYFGSGVSASAPSAFRFHASGGRGSNIAGASLTLAGGISTGTAAGGSLLFQTSSAGSAGSTANTLATRLTIDSTGLALFANNVSVSGNFELTGFVSSNLTPTVTDTYDLGTSALRWRDLYLASSSLHIGTSGDEAVIDYNVAGDYLAFRPDGGTAVAAFSDAGDVRAGNRLYLARSDQGGDATTTSSGYLWYDTTNTLRFVPHTGQARISADAFGSFAGGGDFLEFGSGFVSTSAQFFGIGNIDTGGVTGVRLTVQGLPGYDMLNVTSSSGTSVLRITKGGNIGIGTETPASKLTVSQGDILISPAFPGQNALKFSTQSFSTTTFGGFSATIPRYGISYLASSSEGSYAAYQSAYGGFKFYTGNTNTVADRLAMVITNAGISPNTGNVGIGGISTPNQKLDVAGNILASTSGDVDLILKSTSAAGDQGLFTLRSAGSTEHFSILNGDGTAIVSIASNGSTIDLASGSLTSQLRIGGGGLAILRNDAGPAATLTYASSDTFIFSKRIATPLGVYGNSGYSLVNENLTISFGGSTINGTGSVGDLLTIQTSTGNLTGNILVGKVGGSTRFAFNASASLGIGDSTPDARLEVVASQGFDLLQLSATTAGNGDLFVVRNNGNVGIGTTSPATKVDVFGSSNALRLSYDSDNYSTLFTDAGGTLYLDSVRTAGPTQPWNVVLATVDGGGNVGIGDANPSAKLEVSGGTASISNTLFVESSGGIGIGTTNPTQELHIASGSDGDLVRLQDSDGDCTLNPETGSLTITCPSDRRLKKDIEDSTEALEYLASFHIRDYTVKASNERKTGVIAQELMETHPELVTTTASGLLAVEQPNPWVLIKGIQELDAKITALQAGFGAGSSGNGPLVFDDSSLDTIFDAVVERLASVLGIELTPGSVRADTVESQRLCVGAVCVTEEQFLQMVQSSGADASTPTPTPEESSEPTPEITPSPTPENGSSDEPFVEPTPEPDPEESSTEEPPAESAAEPTP